jgi:hypothetical protein
MPFSSEIHLNFYGVVVHVRCDERETCDRVQSDFGYFQVDARHAREAAPHLVIHSVRQPPDYTVLPSLRASFYSPRNICYRDGHTTYIDYFGNALSVYDRAQGYLTVYSEQLHLLHEIIFLSLLSRVGERLEELHLHRVHAWAIAAKGEAALFMMPSGCGKTTLALEFLQRKLPYRLISEDSPLIDAHGRVLPFPLRIGVLQQPPPEIAAEHVTYLERMEFEAKYLIALEAFGDVLARQPTTPRLVCIGHRTLGTTCAIRQVGFMEGLKAFLRHMVIGVGLYQGVEFLVQSSLLDLAQKAGLFWSRLRSAYAVLRQADVFVVELGRHPASNAETLLTFLRTQQFWVDEPVIETTRHTMRV